jgi:DNA-binding transcriptional MerR regulator
MSHQEGPTTTEQATYPFSKAATELQTEPHVLWRWSQRFALFLGPEVAGDHPHYSEDDLATLRTVLTMQEDGFNDPQIAQHLALRQAELDRPDDLVIGETSAFADTLPDAVDLTQMANGAHVPAAINQEAMPPALRDVFAALADGQQAVLNNQASMREIVGVVVQDNFNLKDENRKLRERMLEMERALAEYQRREETRKERLESRLRALEGTVGGLQQQIAQIVQVLRKRRRGWFW